MNVNIRTMTGADDWAWVNAQVPVLRVEDTCGLMAENADTGERLACCVMDNWANNSVQTHMIITHPIVLRHKFLEFCADYIFNFEGRKRVYGFIPGNNAKALKLNAHLGFKEVFRIPDGFADGEDYVVMQLLKEDCKVIPKQEVA